MAELKKEEERLTKQLNHKYEQDFSQLKSETKDLLAKKEKELEHIYENKIADKENQLW